MNSLSLSYDNQNRFLVAELLRAKRASEAPWVMAEKNGYDVSVRQSERASERTPSVQTLGVEEGHLEVSLTGDLRNATFFLGGICQKKAHFGICYVNERSGTLSSRLR